jgi:transcriptional regulator with XRE-family HTH domain
MNQTQLARRLGIGQARVSRIEMGAHMPTHELVVRVLDALAASDSDREAIMNQLAELQTQIHAWRHLHRSGLREHQGRYGEMEAGAREIRLWSDRVIPGILQTPDYTRAMCLAWNVPDLGDIDGIIEGRLRRQEQLSDRHKQFTFIIGEAALATGDIPAEVLRDQVERLLLLAALRNVVIGIVPASMMVPTSSDFLIFDDAAVVIELDTTEVLITEPEQVARYIDIFGRLQARSLSRPDFVSLITSGAA